MKARRRIRRMIAAMISGMLLLAAGAGRAFAMPREPDVGGGTGTAAGTGGGWSGWEITLVVAAIVVTGALLASLQTYRQHRKPRYGRAAPTA